MFLGAKLGAGAAIVRSVRAWDVPLHDKTETAGEGPVRACVGCSVGVGGEAGNELSGPCVRGMFV
jgi:hypothetical protein